MKFSRLILVFSAVVFAAPVFSQLSGTYTIGGVNPDFENFSKAADSLASVGVSGNVTFNVRPGTYQGFGIGSMQNIGAADTVTFRAENLDSSSVVITGSVYLNSTSNLTFRSLTIRPENGQSNTCITIDKSDKIWFTHCRIEKTDALNFSPNEALVSILFDWSGGTKYLRFSNSTISSEFHTLLINGKFGRVDFEHDTIVGVLRDMFGYPVKNFLYNTILYHDGNLDYTGEYFEGNQFYLNDQFSWLDLRGDCRNNEFYCPVSIESNTVCSNVFHENADFLYSTMRLVDNVFEKELNVSFCHNSSFYFNKFYGNCIFSSDNQKVISNFFYADVIFSQGPNQQIYSNNFGPGSKLEMYWCSAIIKNNILISDTVAQPSTITMVNNNFIPCTACQLTMTGSEASFYDPIYVSANDLHASNPVLIQKAVSLPGTYGKYDIDSLLRKPVASMGANEICLHFPTGPVEQRCNDFICLDMCSDDFTGKYWTPSGLFADSTSSAPVIHLESSGCVYLHDTVNGIVDSLSIIVTPSPPYANQSHTATGYTVHFYNLSYCADSVLWDFGDGNTSAEWNPTHTFTHSGLFPCKLVATNQLGTDSCLFLTEILIVSETELSEKALRIYPNPATTEIRIEAFNLLTGYKLTIYNSSGLKIQESIEKSPVQLIDVSGYKPGIYLLKIEAARTCMVRKIVIQ